MHIVIPLPQIRKGAKNVRKLALIAVLTLLSILGISSAALAAPGIYDVDADYLNSIAPLTALTGNPDGDTSLEPQEGAKETVVFTVTPEAAGKAAPDGNYTDGNANKSGTGTGVVEGYSTDSKRVRRAEGNRYIHGQFAKNTSACASCHMTHTAAGDALLVRNGVYNTCTSCHDGTLGKLSVFDVPNTLMGGEHADNPALFEQVGGGTFGGAINTANNSSMHLPTGYLELAAAPGGNRGKAATATMDTAAGANQTVKINSAAWTADFTCSSCHQPHGSYSDRLLAPNPGNIMRRVEKIAEFVKAPAGDPNAGKFIAVPWADDDTYATWDAVEGRVATASGLTNRITGPWVFGEKHGAGMIQTVLFYQAAPSTDTEGAGDKGFQGFDETPIVKDVYTSGHVADGGLYQLSELFNLNYASGLATLKNGIDLLDTADWGVHNGLRDELGHDGAGLDLVWSNTNRIKAAIVPALVVKVQEGLFNTDGDLVRDAGGVPLAAGLDYEVDTTIAGGEPYIQGLDGAITLWTGANKLNSAYDVGTDPDGDGTDGDGDKQYIPAINNGADFKVYNSSTDTFGITKYQQGVTWFCVGCHTDYYADIFVDYGTDYGNGGDGNAGNGKLAATGLEGLYSQSYRHTINRGPLENENNPDEQEFVYSVDYYSNNASESMTCLSCHYAHGTTKAIMRDSDDAPAATVDVNPSSALKRYVNNAVCWKCHTLQHGDELANSEGYWNSGDVNSILQGNGRDGLPQ